MVRALSYMVRWLRHAWRVGPTRAAWVCDFEAQDRQP